MEWHYALAESSNWPKRGQYKISRRWNGITHRLRVQIGQSEVSIKLAADGMALWHYARTESSNRSKRGQYQISITHTLRVQIGRSEISIKLAAGGMALRTY